MSLPIRLRFAPVLCRFAPSPRRRPSPPFAQAKPAVAIIAALAVFASLPLSVSAQDYWPPDDPNSGVPQQQQYPAPPQYAGSPQYSYAPQIQQSPYAPQAQQSPYAAPAQPYDQSYGQQGYGQQLGQMQPISPDQLTQLVAPIALYPDNLVAQILAASTYPAQVSAAAQWLRSLGNASPDQIAAGANAQSTWDPSIKALTAFPQVLEWLAGNLQWTTSLGNAYYNQPQDVLQTIQVMRQRAEEAGNLQSTPQEEVTDNQGAIDIAPTNPQVEYVPTYNPWTVYGEPVNPYPGFSFLGAIGSFFGSSPVQFGMSFAMNAFMHTPWGILAWGLDWLAHSVLFNHSGYFTRSTSVADWGFPHGGPRAYPGIPQYVHGGYGSRGWNNYGATMRSGYAPHYGPSAPMAQRAGAFNRYSDHSYGYGDARTAEGFNRGFPSRAESPMRALPPQAAYNRYPQPLARSPQFENRQPAYESHQYAYAGRSSMGWGASSNQYRAPENTYRGNTTRSYDAYRGNEFARSQSSGGGFHLFGNHESNSWGGGKAPKSYSYGGGHSNWGGGGSWKAPKESHFGGGGHWGGGGHGGGGHSSSHSSGHHR
jgi:Protein of unknown function (DUF3300)